LEPVQVTKDRPQTAPVAVSQARQAGC